ncbi:MAG: hypothetical protein JNL69_08300 [Bacteroidia bacterium]|nr:hypothetical protein [Bacteroidia bacterium]
MAKKEIKQSTAPMNSKKINAGIVLKLDEWLEKHDKKVFYFLLLCSTIISLLLFDAKVSEGGDDSSYIQRAWDFLYEGKYPYFQGPGYPVVLSVFVKLFGLDLIALKFFSLLCQFGFVWFTYKAFHKRIPFLVLFALISFISFNHFIQYYSSQTFTESFFLLIQSLCIYVTFKIIDAIKEDETWMEVIKNNYLKWLFFGLLFVLLSISKSIAFVAIPGVLLYFILKKHFKQAIFALLFFIAVRLIYQLIVTAFFGENNTDQMEMMLRKDLYKPQGGHEDFGGMVDRFFFNFNTYISLHMYRLFNLRNVNTDASKIIPALSFITTVVLSIFVFFSYKRNKYIFFSSIYMIALCGGIFLGVQANNMQDRLIIIAIPLMFLVFFFGFYELSKQASMAQLSFVTIAIIMLCVTLFKTGSIAQKNTTALKKNMSGDIYYGYTKDWENFLRMSKYCSDSLPDSSQVVSRKPSMSFLYANGKKFVGQFIVTSTDADTVLAGWEKQSVDYVIVASLRMNPAKNNGRVVNTLHRMLQPIAQKYPQKLRLVKSIGETEKCELYEIKY